MARILVTGGSGFLGGVLIDTLLARGHSVVTTVRSLEKAESLQAQRPGISTARLDYKIVEDIAKINAFDDAVVCDPPLSAVIHTASPFHYSIENVKRDMLDPAVNGTVGVLQSVYRYAPTVERVVITSSFAAMYNPTKGAGSKYSEADWNPVTWDDAESPANAQGQSGYRTSKALAEKEAWAFMEKYHPRYTLTVLNPSLILGPVSLSLASLEEVNTSNQRIRDFMTGAARERCPPTGSQFWVDVRDAALAHAVAAERPEVAGKRFFLTAGTFCNVQIVDAIGRAFPELQSALPRGDALKLGNYPPGGPPYGYDNSASIKEFGLTYRSLDESVVDTVKSLMAIQQAAPQ
ncbi:NAD(P)-binding protein [Aspergillus alliaceus]|uniref:NAD(P)-binding protein n=1 Tax=Petromyces alliaceus TaxID=209559 RepID=A0A5N7C8H9_PETAA|nr:NAD(P)-binding protein [Aspergillus alliaceus]